MKKILVISFSDLGSDARVRRQISFLKDSFEVISVGCGNPKIEKVGFFPVRMDRMNFFEKIILAVKLKLHMFESAYWTKAIVEMKKRLLGERFDIIIANDIEALPLSLSVSKEARVLFDAHEYHPGEFEDRFFWRFFFQRYRQYLCKRYIKYCDKMTTVSDGIADKYHNDFGVNPLVITNACEYFDLKPSVVDRARIKLIHHGIANPSRKIESMIRMMDYADERFSLDLMLIPIPGCESYFKRLQSLVKDRNNIRILPPISEKKLIIFTNQYDIGLYIFEGVSVNNTYALPNKLFQFIQARLAVAIGPSIEMAKIVKRYDCGIVARDFKPETMAAELNALTKEKIEYYKSQSDKAAYSASSNENRKKFVGMVYDLVGEYR